MLLLNYLYQSIPRGDLYLKESIEMLSEAGIQFDKHAVKGIDPQLFSEYLIASGKLSFFIIRSYKK